MVHADEDDLGTGDNSKAGEPVKSCHRLPFAFVSRPVLAAVFVATVVIMLSANQSTNAALLAMMRENERAHRERMCQQAARTLAAGPLPPRPRPRTPPKTTSSTAQDRPTPPKAAAVVSEEAAKNKALKELREEVVPLTLDEAEWLEATAKKYDMSCSTVLQRLVAHANTESPPAKKHLFLVVRCRRCSAGARGGKKHDHRMELPAEQWQWLGAVKERCSHASVGKTLRIIIDFYMPLCDADPAFEARLFDAGGAGNAEVTTSPSSSTVASAGDATEAA
eukprot:TRINITY_DN32410_c0_g1_i1.p1 TRINITY_DN32410_c0_g1~~TRINITY_DN32410_c0_g1_i1.p1  ORF type:complete len:301 (-),score=78.74 TRINITY_DN32410_c0_g1_i1:131-967(-)